MLYKEYKSNIDSICPICESIKTKIIDNHLFSNIECLECGHVAIQGKEQNIDKFVRKTIQKNKIIVSSDKTLSNVLEYCYCPYYTIMKFINKIDSIIINKNKNITQCHSFSKQSVKILSQNILVPNTVIEKEDFYIIQF